MVNQQCCDLEASGFQCLGLTPEPGDLTLAGFTIAVSTRTYEPGVSTFISYIACVKSGDEVVLHHPHSDGSRCWHQLAEGIDRDFARQVAFGIGIAALDDDLDRWEVRGQFAFADPDNTSHRRHAQLSRLRLSSLRYEIGEISRQCEGFDALQPAAQRLRQRVSDAYGLLAEMTNSSLADKSDIEMTQRENLNLLLSIIAALVLAPGVVISFDSVTHLTSNPLSLLLSCSAASLLTATLIAAVSGIRLRLSNRVSVIGLFVVASALFVGVVLLVFVIKTTHRIEGLVLLGAGALFVTALIIPWGRRREAEAAPTRWRATWDGIRNDTDEHWTRLNTELQG
jgi:hypothetical protein